jgi:hypothetical protein
MTCVHVIKAHNGGVIFMVLKICWLCGKRISLVRVSSLGVLSLLYLVLLASLRCDFALCLVLFLPPPSSFLPPPSSRLPPPPSSSLLPAPDSRCRLSCVLCLELLCVLSLLSCVSRLASCILGYGFVKVTCFFSCQLE